MEVKNEAYQYQWIINEGLLRDEGTLYGIAGANTQEKVDAIRDYYRMKKAASQTKREQLEKEIDRLSTKLSTTLGGQGDVGNGPNESNLIPIFMQLLLYGGICFFNFYLETYWLLHLIFMDMWL